MKRYSLVMGRMNGRQQAIPMEDEHGMWINYDEWALYKEALDEEMAARRVEMFKLAEVLRLNAKKEAKERFDNLSRTMKEQHSKMRYIFRVMPSLRGLLRNLLAALEEIDKNQSD